MGIFRRDNKEKERDEDFQKESVLREREGERVSFDADLQTRMATLIDPNFLREVSENNIRRAVYPAYSFLNRTSHIDEKDRKLILLNYEYLDILITSIMRNPQPRKDYLDWIESVAYNIFAQFMVNDALHGWKGKLVIEQVRVIRAELAKVKKKGGFP